MTEFKHPRNSLLNVSELPPERQARSLSIIHTPKGNAIFDFSQPTRTPVATLRIYTVYAQAANIEESQGRWVRGPVVQDAFWSSHGPRNGQSVTRSLVDIDDHHEPPPCSQSPQVCNLQTSPCLRIEPETMQPRLAYATLTWNNYFVLQPFRFQQSVSLEPANMTDCDLPNGLLFCSTANSISQTARNGRPQAVRYISTCSTHSL